MYYVLYDYTSVYWSNKYGKGNICWNKFLLLQKPTSPMQNSLQAYHRSQMDLSTKQKSDNKINELIDNLIIYL